MFCSCAWWRIRDRQKILILIRHRWFNNAVENCSIRPKKGVCIAFFSPPECYEFRKWHPVCYFRRPRRYPTQMFNQTGYCLTLKRPVVHACKMPNMLVPKHSAWCEIVRSDGGSNGGGLVLVPLPFSTSVSWSLRSCPIQTEKCINCSAEFPSVFVDDFPRGLTEGCFFFFFLLFLRHLLSAMSPHLNRVFTKCDWALS